MPDFVTAKLPRASKPNHWLCWGAASRLERTLVQRIVLRNLVLESFLAFYFRAKVKLFFRRFSLGRNNGFRYKIANFVHLTSYFFEGFRLVVVIDALL